MHPVVPLASELYAPATQLVQLVAGAVDSALYAPGAHAVHGGTAVGNAEYRPPPHQAQADGGTDCAKKGSTLALKGSAPELPNEEMELTVPQ